MEDWRLIREFVDEGSQAAFARIVARHRGLVYSTCRRELGDPALAEDATQVVFLVLAQKARSLRREVVLSGWLFQTARFAAWDVRKSEQRRRAREEASGGEMREAAAQAQQAVWRDVDPWLHDSLDQLGPKDRDAILLRFFEDRGFAEVAAALGTKEDAARHRVNRALEKMRRFLAARGVVVPAAALGALLAAHALDPAPDAILASPVASARLSPITQGVLKAMRMKQIGGLTAALILGVGALGVGAGLVRALAPKVPAAHKASAPVAPTRRLPLNPRVRLTDAPVQQRPLNDIRVTGNKVVPSAAVIAALGLKAGDMVSDTKLQRSLVRVYNLAWFNTVGPFDLEPKAGGGFTLIIPVKENPGLAGTRPEDFQDRAEIAAAYGGAEDALHDQEPARFQAAFAPNFRAVDPAGRRATLDQYLAQIDGPLGPASLIELNHYGTGSRRSGNLVSVPATITWYRWTRLPGSPDSGCEKLEQAVEDDWHQSSRGWVLETRRETSGIKATPAPANYLRLLRRRAIQGLPY